MKVLVSGSLGLVGSEACRFYLEQGHEVVGIDNNMRKQFFGDSGCGLKNMIEHPRYTHINIDIAECVVVFLEHKFDAIIHCAGQPSHDWAVKDPKLDFTVNALGTLKMLEAVRNFCPDAVFVFLSTNKVYGDRPNEIPVDEFETRYDNFGSGVSESMSVDQCLHSIFGVSKLSADLMVQEYGKYFGIKTGTFRCGCITGSKHAGVPLHGFLSYMAKCKKDKKLYTVYGYKGKQVRDNIHAYDLVTAIDEFVKNPRPGEVYNMGGGRWSNISVLEALNKMGVQYEYNDQPRVGDHRWYISDVSKFCSHYPNWYYRYDMEAILEDLISA